MKYDVNEYLEWCKKLELNPMDEYNVSEFKKMKKNEQETELVHIKDILKDLMDKTIPKKYEKAFYAGVNDMIEESNKLINASSEELLEEILNKLFN